MSLEDATEGLAMPVFLVVPKGQELGDLRIMVRTCVQQVAEVARRVVFDVVHVGDASELIGTEGPRLKGREVDVVRAYPRRATGVPSKVEAHPPDLRGRSLSRMMERGRASPPHRMSVRRGPSRGHGDPKFTDDRATGIVVS